MTRVQRLALGLLSIVVVTAGACSKEKRNAPSPPNVRGVASATAGPLITPQQLAAQPAGLETIRVAYGLLLDQYYKPLKSGDLLNAAWGGVIEELTRQGGVDTGNAPKLSGDRTADFKAFSSSFNSTTTHGDPAAYAYAAVDAMAKSLQDDHTFFLRPDEYKQQQAGFQGTSTDPIFSASMLPGGIGYLRLTSFPTAYATLPDGKTLAEDLDAALGTLDARGVKGWLLDLRDNGGGSSDTIATLTGRFIPDGVVAVLIDGKGQRLELPVDGHYFPHPHPHPLAVLINGKSSSAAEISAAAFREYGVGRLFGQSTAGSVNAAEEFPLPGGAGLEYTIEQVRTGKGMAPLDRKGVEPDQIVEPASGKDAQAEAAEAWLESSGAQPTASPPVGAGSPSVGSVTEIRSELAPYGAKLSDLPSSLSLRLLGEQSFDTPNEYAEFAPQALQLTQTVRGRGWQGEFNQYFGSGDPYTYQISIDLYKDDAGAQQALKANDFPQQYEDVAPPARFGDETVAQTGIVSALGQTRLTWRRGRLVLTALYVSEPGLESFEPLIQLARAMDARAAQSPFR